MTTAMARKRIEAEQGPSNASLDDVIGFAIRRLHGAFGADWQRRFRDRGIAITPMQGGILLLLDENPGIAHNALARLLSIEPPTLVQTLAPLIRTGYVERRPSPDDGRAVALHLSRSGREAMALVRGDIHAHEADVLSGLSPEERAQLLRLARKALRSAPAGQR